MDGRFTPEMAIAHYVRQHGISVAEIGVTSVVVRNPLSSARLTAGVGPRSGPSCITSHELVT